MGLFKSSDVRVALLEEKLSVYEDLSREMLAKLEVAVDKISESIQSISKITIRHEERITQSIESHAAITKLVDTLEEKRKEDKTEMSHRVEEINKKLEEVYKFRYTVLGALIISSLALTIGSNVLSNIPMTKFLPQTTSGPQYEPRR
jgi:oligoendopeptidase F